MARARPRLGHLRHTWMMSRTCRIYTCTWRCPYTRHTHTHTHMRTYASPVHGSRWLYFDIIRDTRGRPPRAAGVVGAGQSRGEADEGERERKWRGRVGESRQHGVVEAAWSVHTQSVPWNDKAAITGWVRSHEPIRERSQRPVGQSGRAFHPSFVSKFARATETQYNEARDGKRSW